MLMMSIQHNKTTVFQSLVVKRFLRYVGDTISVIFLEFELLPSAEWSNYQAIARLTLTAEIISFHQWKTHTTQSSMSSKHRRGREDRPALSHAERAKLAIRQAFQQTSINDPTKHDQYNLHLYENDRQERINEIVDDDDGDLLVERQPLQPASIEPDRSSKIIEANDRRHDAVIFGDKAVEGKSPGEVWWQSTLVHCRTTAKSDAG